VEYILPPIGDSPVILLYRVLILLLHMFCLGAYNGDKSKRPAKVYNKRTRYADGVVMH